MDNEIARYRLINRLEGPDGTALTHGQVARIHAIIDEADQGWFPDNGNQTTQAKWINTNRIQREEGGAFYSPRTKTTTEMKMMNVKVKWAKLVTPDDYKGKKKWVVNIYPSTDEQWKELTEAGVRVRQEKDTNVEYVIGQRNCITTKGEVVTPPQVVDIYRNPFNGQIGNGSICNIIADVIDLSKNDDYKGNMLYLKKVQVVKLVEADEDFDDPEPRPIDEDSVEAL